MNANPPNTKRRFSGCFRSCLVVGLIGGALAFITVFPILLKGTAEAVASKGCLHAAYIARSLDDYAADHQGRYPVGKSSTEIFQSLLDGHYLKDLDGQTINDPGIFYLPMAGKIKAETNHLKPENVCWDITYCVDSAPPEGCPWIFVTGYNIRYTAGSSALSRKERSFLQNWISSPDNSDELAVCYTGNKPTVLHASPDGTIPNFIPADFDPKGKTYRQLTPDGELPP